MDKFVLSEKIAAETIRDGVVREEDIEISRPMPVMERAHWQGVTFIGVDAVGNRHARRAARVRQDR